MAGPSRVMPVATTASIGTTATATTNTVVSAAAVTCAAVFIAVYTICSTPAATCAAWCRNHGCRSLWATARGGSFGMRTSPGERRSNAPSLAP